MAKLDAVSQWRRSGGGRGQLAGAGAIATTLKFRPVGKSSCGKIFVHEYKIWSWNPLFVKVRNNWNFDYSFSSVENLQLSAPRTFFNGRRCCSPIKTNLPAIWNFSVERFSASGIPELCILGCTPEARKGYGKSQRAHPPHTHMAAESGSGELL